MSCQRNSAGGLLVKLFKRTAKLEEKSHLPGPPQAQSQKLNVPKKTKIFVDQTMRERYEGQRMHQVHLSSKVTYFVKNDAIAMKKKGVVRLRSIDCEVQNI